MKDNLPRYTLRIPQILLDKLAYVAEYEGRTKNREIEWIIRRRIAEFEKVHGKIETDGSKDSLTP
ncbi:MAG: Arc family DNA-binding protein [Oscillibacter sp.]|nr:Arc family DNA-binding protein [Oscillibacter sp.]